MSDDIYYYICSDVVQTSLHIAKVFSPPVQESGQFLKNQGKGKAFRPSMSMRQAGSSPRQRFIIIPCGVLSDSSWLRRPERLNGETKGSTLSYGKTKYRLGAEWNPFLGMSDVRLPLSECNYHSPEVRIISFSPTFFIAASGTGDPWIIIEDEFIPNTTCDNPSNR